MKRSNSLRLNSRLKKALFEDEPLSHRLVAANNFDFRPNIKTGNYLEVKD